MGERFIQRKRNPLATSWTSEIHPNIYRGGASKGALNASLEYHAHWNICALITYNSPYLGSPKHNIFPRLSGHNPPVKEKGGHCEYRGLWA